VIRAWLTTNALYLAAAALLGVSAFAGWQTLKLANAKTAIADLRADIANGNATAQKAAADTSTSIVDVLWNADTAYQRGLDDAKSMADRDAAALRDGTLRMRREWAACETGRLADGSAAAIELGEAVERRNALALAVVRVGAECDAKERTLIAAYNGVRDRINGTEQ